MDHSQWSFPDQRSGGAFISLAPDWVCEVLSPSTARWDRVKKVPVYARYGVDWVWLVDPVARTLEVLRQTRPPLSRRVHKKASGAHAPEAPTKNRTE